jgi:uncharacterized membrane protein YkvA (DUF1232 family)
MMESLLIAGLSRAICSAMTGIDTDKLERDRARVVREFWAKLRRNIRRVPFLEEAVAAYYCAFDPATPLRVKAVLLGALAYFILPIDFVPDFMLVLGYTDDAAVLYAAIRSVTSHIKDSHRSQARAAIEKLSGETQAA